MAAFLESVTPEKGFNCNRIDVITRTNLITNAEFGIQWTFTEIPMVISLSINFTLIINGVEYIWQPKVNVNDPCTEFPIVSSYTTLQEFGEAVLTSLNSRFELLCNYNIEYFTQPGGKTISIRISQINCETFSASINDNTHPNSISNVIIDSGVYPDDIYSVENLSAFLTVVKLDENGKQTKLSQQNAAYDKKTKRACFNIQKAFDLKPHLPSFDKDYTDVIDAVGSYCNYKLVFADKFGDNPIVDCVKSSIKDYTVILGGQSCRNTDELFQENLQLLHNYEACADPNSVFHKPVCTNQPDWMYFYVCEDTAILGSVTIEYEDGTTDQVTTIADMQPGGLAKPMPIEGGKIYYICTGHDQLGFSAHAKRVCRYTYSITDTEQSGVNISINYEVCCPCHPYNCFLAMFNGYGGIESVLMRGKKKHSYETTFETIQKVKTKDFQLSDGAFQDICHMGKEKISVNSGWHNLNYVRHLRNLISTEVWLIDNDNFLPTQKTTKSIQDKSDGLNLVNGATKAASFNFEFYIAFEDCFYNCITQE